MVNLLSLSKDNIHGDSGNAGTGESPVGIELIGAVFGVGVKDPFNQMDAGENIAIRRVFSDRSDV